MTTFILYGYDMRNPSKKIIHQTKANNTVQAKEKISKSNPYFVTKAVYPE